MSQFTRDLRQHTGAAKIAADVDSADLSGVWGIPTFFINGKRTMAPTTSTPSRVLRGPPGLEP